MPRSRSIASHAEDDRSNDPEPDVHLASVQASLLPLGPLLSEAARMRRTIFDQAAKPLGVTRSQWLTLAILARQPSEGLTQTDISRLLGVGKPAAGGLVDRLEHGGYLKRRADPVDRRVRRIYLTRRGRKVIDQMSVVTSHLNHVTVLGIPEADVAVAEDVMRRISENLGQALKTRA